MKSLKVVVSKQSKRLNKQRQPSNRHQHHQTKLLPSKRKKRQRKQTLKEVKSKKSAQTTTQSSIQMQSSLSPPSRERQMLKMQVLLPTKNLRPLLQANSQRTLKKKLMTAKLQLNLTQRVSKRRRKRREMETDSPKSKRQKIWHRIGARLQAEALQPQMVMSLMKASAAPIFPSCQMNLKV